MCGKNEYILFMGPFGSDQSRHVDHFGAKKRNFHDFVPKKWSFGLLVGEKSTISTASGHTCIYKKMHRRGIYK